MCNTSTQSSAAGIISISQTEAWRKLSPRKWLPERFMINGKMSSVQDRPDLLMERAACTHLSEDRCIS